MGFFASLTVYSANLGFMFVKEILFWKKALQRSTVNSASAVWLDFLFALKLPDK